MGVGSGVFVEVAVARVYVAEGGIVSGVLEHEPNAKAEQIEKTKIKDNFEFMAVASWRKYTHFLCLHRANSPLDSYRTVVL